MHDSVDHEEGSSNSTFSCESSQILATINKCCETISRLSPQRIPSTSAPFPHSSLRHRAPSSTRFLTKSSSPIESMACSDPLSHQTSDPDPSHNPKTLDWQQNGAKNNCDAPTRFAAPAATNCSHEVPTNRRILYSKNSIGKSRA